MLRETDRASLVVKRGLKRDVPSPKFSVWRNARSEGVRFGGGRWECKVTRLATNRALRVAEQIDLATCRGVSLTSEIAAWEREPRRLRWGMIALLAIVGLLAWSGYVK
jgi:hypothetical protein